MALSFRSTVKLSLFNLLKTATFGDPINGFSTWAFASQRLKMFGSIDKGQQPALFLAQHHEQYERRGSGLPPRIYILTGAWCFFPSGDDAIIGDQILDTLTAAIEAVLQPPPGTARNEQTLGGLLDPSGWVRVDMTASIYIRDPGDIDGQGLLVLPIRIMLPTTGSM
jgi:hypothetical protein